MIKFQREKGQIVIIVNDNKFYCPTIYDDSSEDFHKYELAFLQSSMPVKEMDYYKVKIEKNSIGYIFPLTLLAEQDISTVQDITDKYFYKFANIGITLLLNYFFSKNNNIDKLDDESIFLDKRFDNGISIFIYRKEIIQDVEQYRQSLYMNGYIPLPEAHHIDNLYLSSVIENNRKEKNNNALILESNSKLWEFHSTFFKRLYKDILPFVGDPFYRYFSLYQVFEIVMDAAVEKEFLEITRSYSLGKKNHRSVLKELRYIEKERHILNKLHENVPLKDICFSEFINYAKDIFGKLDIDNSDDYVNLMYNIRNLMVHNLSTVLPYENEMKKLSDEFEFTVNNFLNRREDLIDTHNQILFVVDKNQSLEDNEEKLRKIYNKQ